ncbi:MAG: hypothetical protein RQ826_05890, partial [Xanthomonadales bacterium]|nr:hypothetical protein [Xanthomonadales bacterium]
MPESREPTAALGPGLRRHPDFEPGRPLLLTARGLRPAAGGCAKLLRQLEDLAGNLAGPLVLSCLSNAQEELNPFAGLPMTAEAALSSPLSATLVSALAPGQAHEWDQ